MILIQKRANNELISKNKLDIIKPSWAYSLEGLFITLSLIHFLSSAIVQIEVQIMGVEFPMKNTGGQP